MQADAILTEILANAVKLAQDQFGNYVVQHVVEHGKQVHKEAMITALKSSLVMLSKQKFSSNVIEKCLQFGSDRDRDTLIREMIGKDHDSYAGLPP